MWVVVIFINNPPPPPERTTLDVPRGGFFCYRKDATVPICPDIGKRLLLFGEGVCGFFDLYRGCAVEKKV